MFTDVMINAKKLFKAEKGVNSCCACCIELHQE